MPRSRLRQIVSFVGIAPGPTVLPHNINFDGVQTTPDLVWAVTTGAINVAVDANNVTVTNLGAAAVNVDVYLFLDHTIDRAIGADGATGLVPRPFIVLGEAAGAAVGQQAFTYVHAGGAASDFSIPLPVARANDNYIPQVSCGGVVSVVGIDCPDLIATDRQVGQFRVITTANVQNGDRLDVVIIQRN